ncbi:hypothetical protein PIROE2DRAFT_62613 [Piromyces sp. E2]|nr:hypothetical protein PIROE2DRAFT_62613 [Piromyces sp. E2]|eukprot:OUM61266.1 hypothetical protein PIROE2DRAFT_62613 [Piromyces sp. E2]
MSQRYRSRGNRKAADQQKDSTNIVLNIAKTIACGQTIQFLNLFNPKINMYAEDWYNTGTAAINIYDVMLNNEFYQNYASMYDQVKINSIKVHVNPSVWATSRDSNPSRGYTLPNSLILVTAWDRSGLDENQFLVDNEGRRYCILADDITSYSSAIVKHFGNGGSGTITRNLYPSSMNEKMQFVSTRDIQGQYVRQDSEPYAYELRRKVEDISLPNNLIRWPGVQFKPTFLIGVFSPYKVSYQTISRYEQGEKITVNEGNNKLYPSTFDLDFYIDVTFRGLRYNKVV